ncbi:MAG: PH domain-containing protein [Jatrophihabitans sp.]
MDTPSPGPPAPDSTTPVARFAPDRRYTAAAAAGAIIAALLVVLATDAPSRLMAGVACVVLILYAASDLVFSPRLTVTPAGLVIHSPLTRARLVWDEVESVHADSRVRLGLRSTTLEVDAGATFAVFSRRALGADPEDAAGLIRTFRPG